MAGRLVEVTIVPDQRATREAPHGQFEMERLPHRYAMCAP